VGALFLLSACSVVPNWANPIEWYRDVTGASANDPGPDAPDSQNLAKGSQQPYPNLASVPRAPTNALSAAEREKLQNSLLADRQNARYVENGQQYAAVAPQSAQPLTAQPLAAQPGAPGAGAAGQPSADTYPNTQPQESTPPESPPRESPLTTPAVRSVPQGEAPRQPPPAPTGVASRASPSAAPSYQPSAPIAPTSAAGGAARAPVGQPGVAVPVGVIAYEGNSTHLTAESVQRLGEVAQLSRQTGGRIHVVGYPRVGVVEGDGLAAARAKAVAAELVKLGIPASSILTRAQAPPEGQPGGAVELDLEY
jgi:outer membrane protein OmpA-like peptidoglycan-associated protein